MEWRWERELQILSHPVPFRISRKKRCALFLLRYAHVSEKKRGMKVKNLKKEKVKVNGAKQKDQESVHVPPRRV